ncbi:MAG: phosphoribosylanthranilate isomerase, partial [Planctomycetaceae bacterium]
YAPSPRCVTPEVATEICRVVPETIDKVGVFVNHAVSDVVSLTKDCKLTGIQLHGDESPFDLAHLRSELPDIKLIRAFRIQISDEDAILESWACVARDLDECRRLGLSLFASLIDAFVAGSYGGTGRTIFGDGMTAAYDKANWPAMILAGGLTPENVVEAIKNVRPWGVDVASGVESSPGVKDRMRVERFIRLARAGG